VRLLGILAIAIASALVVCADTASAQEVWNGAYGGEVREQYELFRNEEWGRQPADGDGYQLQRYMLHAEIKHGTRWRLFGELKSGIDVGRVGGPRATDADHLDLHQGFVEVVFRPSGAVLTLRVGRQELSYGSQRLISVRETPNVRQSFDGIKGVVDLGAWRIDAFASRPATTAVGIFDDKTDAGRALWGAYVVRTLDPAKQSGVDLYYLGYQRSPATFVQGSATEHRHSIGARYWATGARVDRNFEAVAQFGTFGSSRISAWTLASDTGVRMNDGTGPRVGLRADVTSGDANAADDRLGTFNAMFPKGAYFGLVTTAGPANHIDLHPEIAFRPTSRLAVTANWLFYWRYRTADGIYGVAGQVLVRPTAAAQSRFVGQAPGVEITVEPARNLTVTTTLAAFTAGSFVREAVPAAQTTKYFGLWTRYRF
jgi:hypothetical protein